MHKRTQEEIMSSWKGDITKPLVSVCTITYNHEKFIAEALDSFLMQETDFPFEIVIDDDCSTDKNAQIIKEYADRFSHIIKANLREKNVGVMTNYWENIHRAKGKYIALCEGDDYWTDSKKLQTQLDFLETHDEISMVFENAEIHQYDEDENIVNIEKFNENLEEGYIMPSDLVQEKRITPTASVVFRKNCDQSIFVKESKNFAFGDTPLFLTLLKCGKIYYINNVSSVYRRHPSGAVMSTFNNPNMYFKLLYTYKFMKKLYPDIDFKDVINKHIVGQYNNVSHMMLINKKYHSFLYYKFISLFIDRKNILNRLKKKLLRIS